MKLKNFIIIARAMLRGFLVMGLSFGTLILILTTVISVRFMAIIEHWDYGRDIIGEAMKILVWFWGWREAAVSMGLAISPVMSKPAAR